MKWCEIFSQLYQRVDGITCRNSKHTMLGFPLITQSKLLEWNLEVSASSKLLPAILRVKQSLIRELAHCFPHLKAVNLNRQRLFPPLRHIHWTSENITVAATAIRPPWHAEYVAATCYSVLYCWYKGILDGFIYLFIFWKHNGRGVRGDLDNNLRTSNLSFDNLGIITAKRHEHTDIV